MFFISAQAQTIYSTTIDEFDFLGENLQNNGNVESGATTGWAIGASGLIGVVSDFGQGSYSISDTAGVTYGFSLYNARTSGTYALGEHRVSYSIRSSLSSGINTPYFHTGGTQQSLGTITATLSTSWQTITGYVTVSNANNTRLQFNVSATTVIGESVLYADNVDIREARQLHEDWFAVGSNAIRDSANGNFFQTAYSDTLLIPLSDATLGSNQEWKFTLSNKDTVTAWIGSRASAKSTVKTIPGGATFGSNTVYFGDGFSLSGDSLVIAFPADTASVDNIVLSKASHHLLNSVNQRNNLNGYGDY